MRRRSSAKWSHPEQPVTTIQLREPHRPQLRGGPRSKQMQERLGARLGRFRQLAPERHNQTEVLGRGEQNRGLGGHERATRGGEPLSRSPSRWLWGSIA